MNSNQFRGWLVIFLILIAFVSFTSQSYNPKHSIYNDGELGTSSLHSSLQQNSNLTLSRILISPFGLSNHEDIDFMVIIGSERAYTDAEVSAYEEFVADGGTLVIFEDFGHAQDIAERMGISYFDGVLRERNDQITINRPTQFLVRDLTSQLFGLEYEIYVMVSEAAGISDLQGLSNGNTFPLLLSTPSTFIDRDDDNVVDNDDFQIEYGTPVGLFKQYEEGLITVISDASIPLNMYNDRTVTIQDQPYRLPNILWSTLLLRTIANYANTTSIVFDESHQQIILGSSSGILNLIASTWVGIFNSTNLIGFLFLAVVVFALLTNRDLYGKLINKVRKAKESQITAHQFVSNPTLSERGLSEQYILYQRMGDGFLHIANLELYKQIKETGKADDFIQKIDEQYGDITANRSNTELLELHQKMRNYIADELLKWL